MFKSVKENKYLKKKTKNKKQKVTFFNRKTIC